jgi:hypothetical protein
MVTSRNVAEDRLLAGVPRSGTTLVCRLLNDLPNVVALVEPMRINSLRRGMGDEACDRIAESIAKMRASILCTGRIRHREGSVADNMFDFDARGGLRRKVAFLSDIGLRKQLDTGFTLVVKHPAAFTALLDLLSPKYPCFAMIRNPLPVLASWNTVAAPFQRGHSPAAERFDGKLRRELSRIPDPFDRQLHLLSWYFERYSTHLSAPRILRYEDIVRSWATAAHTIAGTKPKHTPALENQNASRLYRQAPVRELTRRLLKSDGAYWMFYTKESVAWLSEQLCHSQQ